jgi:hypothetical protein
LPCAPTCARRRASASQSSASYLRSNVRETCRPSIRQPGFPAHPGISDAILDAHGRCSCAAQVLNVSLAYLLTPDDGEFVEFGPERGYDGDGVRWWLATGAGGPVMPASALAGESLSDDQRAQVEWHRRRQLAQLSEALLCAAQAREPTRPIGARILAEAQTYRVALGGSNLGPLDAQAAKNPVRVDRWLRTETVRLPLPPEDE